MSILGKYNNVNISQNISKIVQIKLVMIGDSSVGKTSIVTRLVSNKFATDHRSTIGGAFNTLAKEDDDGNVYKYQMWDTAGQERFRSLIPMYVNNANIIFLVFDVTSYTSFYEIKDYWHEYILKTSKETQPKLVLLGNKVDLITAREVSKEMAKSYADEKGMEYIECSAKTRVGVDNISEIMTSFGKEFASRPVKEDEDIILVDDILTETIIDRMGCNNVRCIT